MGFGFYKILLYAFKFCHWLYSRFKPEIKLVHGLKIKVSEDVLAWRREHSSKKLIILHCASLGEFEMSIPLYNSLTKKLDCIIIFSFFSPSGYDHASLPIKANKIYLPFDIKADVTAFIDSLNPEFFIFIKYEYWFTLLNQLNKLDIPYGFVNVIDQKKPPIFRWKFVRDIVSKSEFFCATNEKSSNIYKPILNLEIKIFNDLRYANGHLLLNQTNHSKYSFIQASNYDSVVVCGSIYPSDFKIIKNEIRNSTNILWILAPHKINTEFDKEIASEFEYSKLSKLLGDNSIKLNSKVLIVDTIGDLKYLYSLGTLAYIGGGFNNGIHNIIEPISFGLNVISGPKIDSFPEALKLKKEGKVCIVDNAESFSSHLQEHTNKNLPMKLKSKSNKSLPLFENLNNLTDYILRNEN